MTRAFVCLLLLAFTGGIGRAESAADLIRRADALDAKHRTAEAVELYLQADALKPGDADILRLISKQYAQQMGDPGVDSQYLGGQALAYALRAVEAGPDNSNAHLALAIVYGKISYLKPAKERMADSRLIESGARRAAELDPRNDLAWHVLGRWNYEVANLGGPVKFFAETLYGKFPPASNEKALEYFQKAVALKPDSLLHHAELGRALARLGRKEEARAALEKALAMPSREKDDEETKTRARKALSALD